MEVPTLEQMARQYCEDRFATAKALREQATKHEAEAAGLRKQADEFEALATASLASLDKKSE
jgi:hypothetical protein